MFKLLVPSPFLSVFPGTGAGTGGMLWHIVAYITSFHSLTHSPTISSILIRPLRPPQRQTVTQPP